MLLKCESAVLIHCSRVSLLESDWGFCCTDEKCGLACLQSSS